MKDDKSIPTQERLLLAATKIFAQRGFDGATTRVITTEAHANLQSIPFYFESKEKLYEAALERVAQLFVGSFESLFQEIDYAEEQNQLKGNGAWNYIVEMLGRLTEWVLDDRYRYELLLVNHDLLYPTTGIHRMLEPLARVYDYFAKLLLSAAGSDDVFWANSYSYSVISTFFTFNNMPLFLEAVLREDVSNLQTILRARMQLKCDMLTSVEAVVKSHCRLEQ